MTSLRLKHARHEAEQKELARVTARLAEQFAEH